MDGARREAGIKAMVMVAMEAMPGMPKAVISLRPMVGRTVDMVHMAVITMVTDKGGAAMIKHMPTEPMMVSESEHIVC